MKFPSLNQLWLSFTQVYKRFCFPICYALIGTLAAFALTYAWRDDETAQQLIKFIYLGNFGMAMSLALALYAETHPLPKAKFYLSHVIILVLLALIYLLLAPNQKQADVFVLLIIGFAVHLLVALAAFNRSSTEVGFWQLNKTFFLRFATSALYSAVLFAGLSIALLSIHTLFNIKWDSEIYLRLWIIIVGLFNTIFFLAGIPQPLAPLNQNPSYPKALKIFTQYVLIPLASIYLLILLVYEVKILLQWSLPNSSVAILVLGYAVFGMLSILLVHPIRKQEENKWIQFYSKSFYVLMLPLLLLLSVAIWKRVADYGITESRYILIVLALWLAFVTLYFLIKGRDHIRIVPISLLIVSVCAMLGPWGIKSVSKASQTARLAKQLSLPVTKERDVEIRNLVRYLNENYGAKTLQPFVKMDLNRLEQQQQEKLKNKKLAHWDAQQKLEDTVLTELKISKTAETDLWMQYQRNYSNAQAGEVDLQGAIKLVEVNSSSLNTTERKTFDLQKQKFQLALNKRKQLVLSENGKAIVSFPVAQLLQKLHQNQALNASTEGFIKVPNAQMQLEKVSGNYLFKLRFEQLSGYFRTANKQPENVQFSAYLLVHPKM
ncbi:DUF4153 domain-containing protein [Pelobium manganitolerans]|uniref:DUF4153 domain-containing protein n=1 Tax=Pelobium manganitolerans TaxID=1842495 RepID=UPI003FA39BDF